MPTIIFEGPDGSGKTTIAKALSDALNIPYFKQRKGFERAQKGRTIDITKYGDRILLDFIEQTHMSVIMDRFYPTEWVYGQVMSREVDIESLFYLDRHMMSIDPFLILCVKDDVDSYIDSDNHLHRDKVLSVLQKYYDFIEWTHIQNILVINTTDQDLEGQLKKISTFILERMKEESE